MYCGNGDWIADTSELPKRLRNNVAVPVQANNSKAIDTVDGLLDDSVPYSDEDSTSVREGRQFYDSLPIDETSRRINQLRSHLMKMFDTVNKHALDVLCVGAGIVALLVALLAKNDDRPRSNQHKSHAASFDGGFENDFSDW